MTDASHLSFIYCTVLYFDQGLLLPTEGSELAEDDILGTLGDCGK